MTVQEISQYLERHFVTLSQLAQRSETAPEVILMLIAHECIPGHSYEIKSRMTVGSFVFGDTVIEEDVVERYYAPTVAVWVRRAQELAAKIPLREVSLAMKETFRSDYRTALFDLGAHKYDEGGCFRSETELDEEAFDRHFEDTWKHWVEGTYGVCTRNADSAANIARKNVAVSRLSHLTANGQKKTYSQKERDEILKAIVEYDEVALPFAPHDYPSSSRKRLVDNVIPYLEAVNEVGSPTLTKQTVC